MQSDARTVARHLSELPVEPREALEAVREGIPENLPDGLAEELNWGVMTCEPPSCIPDAYNQKPLLFAALASQKHTMSIYISSICEDDAEQ